MELDHKHQNKDTEAEVINNSVTLFQKMEYIYNQKLEGGISQLSTLTWKYVIYPCDLTV